jgi:hypothetical protein
LFLGSSFLAAIEQEKKDKIGERVAALQQLVSPFGKVGYFQSFRCIPAVFVIRASGISSRKRGNHFCFSWLQTDTASVLQEASGYIKFLHQQLEVFISVTAHGTMIFNFLILHFCDGNGTNLCRS